MELVELKGPLTAFATSLALPFGLTFGVMALNENSPPPRSRLKLTPYRRMCEPSNLLPSYLICRSV